MKQDEAGGRLSLRESLHRRLLTTLAPSLLPSFPPCPPSLLALLALLLSFAAFSCRQRADLGIDTTILGHSESRSLAKESEALVGSKTKRALDAGMNVIVCIGETLEEREAGKLEDVLKAQLTPVCEAIGSVEGGWARTIIAYEPVWAIGTGVTATPAQAQDAHKVVRAYLSTNCSAEVGESTRILYGGSVKAANCGELIQLPDVDGFLVGGASLKPEFADIVATAAKA